MERYYREQLALLREGASEFAEKHPALAPMLLKQGGDPDVERILEGTAWLCGSIRKRLDQCAPELVQALLGQVFPQALLPVPSTTMMRFFAGRGTSGVLSLPAGTQAAGEAADGTRCIFSTTEDLSLLPLSVSSITSSRKTVTLELESPSPLRSFFKSPLVLYLDGSLESAAPRYDALTRGLESLSVSSGPAALRLPSSCVAGRVPRAVDPRLPAARRGLRHYMEMLRFFHAPEQFLFIEINGLDRLDFTENDRRLVLEFRFHKEPPAFDASSFVLNVVPAWNIFPSTADPITVDHTRVEYPVRPQGGDDSTEILGVVRGTAMFRGGKSIPCITSESYDATGRSLSFSSGYRIGHSGQAEHLVAPLYASAKGLSGGFPMEKATLSLELLCCNRLGQGTLHAGDLRRKTDLSPALASFTNITTPTPMVPRPTEEGQLWRFLSLMNANLLSLASAEKLRSLLELHMPSSDAFPEGAAAASKVCRSILSFSTETDELLLKGGLYRGRLLRLELDPSGFPNEGAMVLFADVLDRFLAGFSGINTYTRLVLYAGGERIHSWPPRLGERRLI